MKVHNSFYVCLFITCFPSIGLELYTQVESHAGKKHNLSHTTLRSPIILINENPCRRDLLTKGGGFGKLLNNKFANVGVQIRLWLREYQMEQILEWIKSRKQEAILGAIIAWILKGHTH